MINENNSVASAREIYVESSLPKITDQIKEAKISKLTLEILSELDMSPPDAVFHLTHRVTLLLDQIEQLKKNKIKAKLGTLVGGVALVVCAIAGMIFGGLTIVKAGVMLSLSIYGGSYLYGKMVVQSQYQNMREDDGIFWRENRKIVTWKEKVQATTASNQRERTAFDEVNYMGKQQFLKALNYKRFFSAALV